MQGVGLRGCTSGQERTKLGETWQSAMLCRMSFSQRPLLKHTLILAAIFLAAQVLQVVLYGMMRPTGFGTTQGAPTQFATEFLKISALGFLLPTLLFRWRSVHKVWLVLLGSGLGLVALSTAAYNGLWERDPLHANLIAIGTSTFLLILIYWLTLIGIAVVLWLKARKKAAPSRKEASSTDAGE